MDMSLIGSIFGICGIFLAFAGVLLGYYLAKKDAEIISSLKGKDLETYLKYREETSDKRIRYLLIVFGLIIAITAVLNTSSLNQILLVALGVILSLTGAFYETK